VAFAEVAVHTDMPYRQAFSYAVPPGMAVLPGSGVLVPFGRQTLPGVVLEVGEHPAFAGETRQLLAAAGDLLTRAQIELAVWLSRRYLAPLYPCVALMRPPGFEKRLTTAVSPTGLPVPADLDATAAKLLARVQATGELDVTALRRSFKSETAPTLAELRRLGLVRERLVYAVPSLDLPAEGGTPVAAPPPTAAQRAAVTAISSAIARPINAHGHPAVFLLHGVTGSGKTEVYLAALERAVASGRRGIILVPEIGLTPQAVARFEARFPGRVAVLHSGVTGARRERLWHAIRAGRYAAVIGPRSALFAPQPDLGLIVIDEEHEWTYKQHEADPRYHARDVAVRLAALTGATLVLGSATPDVVSYARARAGQYQLVRLPERAGGGAPLPAPAFALSRPEPGASPVSSVAPRATRAEAAVRPTLSARVAQGEGTRGRGGPALPPVQIVDLALELREGNRGIFSRALETALAETLARGEQAILFLNRRGSASFVLCRECGHVPACGGCGVPYTVHGEAGLLRCHHCNRQRRIPPRCPGCSGTRVRYFGLGTQRVEAEVRERFPSARVLRWDRDAVTKAEEHAAIIRALLDREADIVVGTQMLAKGHDLPNVTLVGVVSADIALNMPDFRAGERAFQLLTQVAGRAGRGERPGRVIIQTYTPDHYAIRAAARHDYETLARAELRVRREAGYPPFGRLTRLVYSHTNERYVEEEARRLAAELRAARERLGLPGVDVIGPAPAFHARVRGRWRWGLTLRAPDPAELLAAVTLRRGWTVDVDPVSLL
jgi:primosomal protein N' (replication factor Y)